MLLIDIFRYAAVLMPLRVADYFDAAFFATPLII